jgi:hypothetical protein
MISVEWIQSYHGFIESSRIDRRQGKWMMQRRILKSEEIQSATLGETSHHGDPFK